MNFHFILKSALLCGLLGVSFALAAPTSDLYPASGANYAKYTAENPPLVPMPQKITWAGKSQVLKSANIQPDSKAADVKHMDFIESELTQFFKAHEVKKAKSGGFTIQFKTGKLDLPEDVTGKRAEEAYKLEVTEKGAFITASTTKGFYYAMQTLNQLIIRRDSVTTVALCSITDWPDLEIRGFMNDVGRNYMPMSLIKQELDAMTRLKFNVYHFHFTENPGWRLESKLYPELNNPKHFTRMPGKFYTQKEFKELVEYCRMLNILVIPEMDMPGHSEAFRKAMGLSKMEDPKATEALVKLIGELASLVPKEHMPYIHIGTDEVKGHERVSNTTLAQYFKAVEDNDRQPIRWHKGQNPKGYTGAYLHLWVGRYAGNCIPPKGSVYIDSQESYVNHADAFETGPLMYFRRPCPYDHAEGKGFILCSWPDLPITDPRNQVLQTPVYPAMAFVAESIWNNPHPAKPSNPKADDLLPYWANLPQQGTDLLKQFAEYEDRVLAIRDRFMHKREFTYVRQSNVPWKIIGPFPHGGDSSMVFPPEELKSGKPIQDTYTHEGQTYAWHEQEYTGHTLMFKHYANYPTFFNGNKNGAAAPENHTFYALSYIYSPKAQTVPFWVSAQTWQTSSWAFGMVNVPGKWHHSDPKFWVNGKEIAPPKWENPLLKVEKENDHVDMKNENYTARKPHMIALKKGWNQVLIKSPSYNDKATGHHMRRWMFTFAPILVDESKPMGVNIKEFPGLKFSTTPQ